MNNTMHLLEHVKTAELGWSDGASLIIDRGPLCEPAQQVLGLFRIPGFRQQFLYYRVRKAQKDIELRVRALGSLTLEG